MTRKNAKTHAEHRDSEIRYRILFEEAGDGIFILENRRIVDLNQKACTLFACNRDQLIGKIPFDLSPTLQPNGKRSDLEADSRITEAYSGSHQFFEWQHRRPNGTLFDAEVSLALVELANAANILAIMRDITIRKQAVEELKRLKDKLQQENIYLQEEINIEHNFGEIIGRSIALRKVLSNVETVAVTDSSVLIMGETGTGKELIARAIHSIGKRKNRPLVKVNCAALPANLIESELFGHEKGAFTGALIRRIGRFELAHGGTIFLDEVAELPQALQSKLLRVLQDGEYERVGGSQTLKVDVRVIAATNRDIEKLIRAGEFREDLFYRLNVFPIFLPPLRDRKEDISVLANHFAVKYSAKCGKKIESIPQKTLEALQNYNWPGNVRELQNIIERGVIVCRGTQLKSGDWLPFRPAQSLEGGFATMEEAERNHIIKALKITNGLVSGEKGAAKILGLNPQTLYSRMKRLSITRKELLA
jgi:PAS domain S-box-containing protein